MKKIGLLMLLILSFFSVSLFANTTKTELSIGGSYSKSLLTGSTKKMNQRIDLFIFEEVPKLHDWELGKGLSVQHNQKKNITTVVPTMSLRYYPFNSITPFVEVYGGVPLNVNDQKFGWKLGGAVGVGREAVVVKLFTDFTDGKVMEMHGDILNVGLMVGYRF